MLMKWTALVITFRPSAGEKAETAKQRLEQKNALLLSLCAPGVEVEREPGAHVAVCARAVPLVHRRPPPSSAGAKVRGDGRQMSRDWWWSAGQESLSISCREVVSSPWLPQRSRVKGPVRAITSPTLTGNFPHRSDISVCTPRPPAAAPLPSSTSQPVTR